MELLVPPCPHPHPPLWSTHCGTYRDRDWSITAWIWAPKTPLLECRFFLFRPWRDVEHQHLLLIKYNTGDSKGKWIGNFIHLCLVTLIIRSASTVGRINEYWTTFFQAAHAKARLFSHSRFLEDYNNLSNPSSIGKYLLEHWYYRSCL